MPNECTVYMTPVVCIEVKGTYQPKSKDGFPRIRKDGGLISKLNAWLLKNRIFSVVPAGHNGGGSFMGFYTPEDAQRIAKWLQQQEEVQQPAENPSDTQPISA